MLSLILASNIWSISSWSEARGVYDDFCYLRQAHLFQTHGLGGLNTNVSRDEYHYLSTKMNELNVPAWENPGAPPVTPRCRLQINSSSSTRRDRLCDGHVSTGVPGDFAFWPGARRLVSGCLPFSTEPPHSILTTAAFADLALYMMINPSKASYSMAPTMVVCALAGFLTAHLFVRTPQRHRTSMTILTGLVVGLAVNFRLANLFLSADISCFLVLPFCDRGNSKRSCRADRSRWNPGGNHADPDLQRDQCRQSILDNVRRYPLRFERSDNRYQCPAGLCHRPAVLLLVLASVWVVAILRLYKGGTRSVALVTALNLVVNVAFFMTHPTFNPYYVVPIAMLSLWSLLFASLMWPVESEPTARAQAARA